MAKVLLVEDDNNLREIFEMRLQAEGYQTLTASDGEEALVVSLKEKPDLIIADIMMPKMSGFEMLETLRAAPDTNNIKVIIMTALGQAEDQARGEKLGVVKYLVKSQVTLEDFVRVVKEIVPPGEGAAKTDTTEPVQGDEKSTNQKESEKDMPPADANPTPTNDAPASSDANPISDAPAGDSQMSTDQAQDAMNKQVNDFASGPPAANDPVPAADPVAPASDSSSAGTDMPPAPMPGPDAPAPTPPATDGAPAPDGPATPTPPGGM